MDNKTKFWVGVCKGICLGCGVYAVWAYGKVRHIEGYSNGVQDCQNVLNELIEETKEILSEEK